jgi:hypothetical protein
MTPPPTEAFLAATTPPAGSFSNFGQTVTVASADGGSGFTLVSYLTAPLPSASRLDYVLLNHEDADDWLWTFSFPGSSFILKSVSGQPVADVVYGGTGQLETRVEVVKGNTSRATLTMTQQVVEPGAQLAFLATTPYAMGKDIGFSMREVCGDFKDYIDAAAAATGANGIPARLLAGVLMKETRARPKDGSPRALALRRSLAGEWDTPRLDFAIDWVDRKMGEWVPKMHLHDIRDVELEMVRGYANGYAERTDPTVYFSGRKTLGVGQIAFTTAAMALDKIPWRELREASRVADLDAIEDGFQDLDTADYLELFNTLRFPKTNIDCAAQLLAKIKNRAHRYPTMSARDLLSDGTAISVIATEYNRGAFSTPTANFKPNTYGERVRQYVVAPSTIELELFFPDTP